MANLSIGQLAKRTGVPIDTIRYYACSGHGRAQDCPILNALGGESAG